MKLGDCARSTRIFDQGDIDAFAALTGLAQRGGAAPEPLVAALFSHLLGVELPGFGTNYLKQELRFLAPAPIGEPLAASVEITRLRPDKSLVDLRTLCRRADGVVICEGRALVRFERSG